jgi:hypothetical protein
MRLFLLIILISACFAALFFACYAPVFFQDRQFGYRDAGHYYYPLYQRVQAEWNEGRWPLWEPEENAGVPLLGNPTAAVLYPGKVVYALLPYAWGARVYVVAHTALAFVAMLVLMRSWRTSWTGSALSALAYAFGAPVLFQYCNIIYLVGAAWLPLGFHAVDRWVRLGRRWGLIELAVVLAMQTLGGDPQAAYLLGLAAIGYAAGLAWARSRAGAKPAAGTGPPSGIRARWWWIPLLALAVVAWVAGTLVLARWLPRHRPEGYPPRAFAWMVWVPLGVAAAWVLAGLAFLGAWRRRGWRAPLAITWLGLALSAALAMAACAVQLLPVIEFTQQTARAVASGPHDIHPFSIEPLRLVELIWPNILGIQFEGNTAWLDAFHLPGPRPKIWVPSLYLGGLTLLLASGAMAMRRTAWRVWLSVIVVVSLLGSLGQYTSPIWAARVLAVSSSSAMVRDLIGDIGPLDAQDTTPIRLDRYLRDGDDGFYWWLSTLLPGFRQFRFPAKLFTFTSLGLAALAGLGWDRLGRGHSRGFTALASSLLVLSLALLAAALLGRPGLLAALRTRGGGSLFGPFDAQGAYDLMVGGLVHGAIMLGLGLVVIRLVRTHPAWAAALALTATTGDLILANAHYVLTVPQAMMEPEPEVSRLLAEAERMQPATGPYRVHRMPTWNPRAWALAASTQRVREFVDWERNTLTPKYGINYGIEYTHTMGVAELYDYEWYFGGFPRIVRSSEVAKALGIEVGQEVIYFPRRSFDMWNTRYFVVPMLANGWRDEFRGYASFAFDIDPIYPDAARFREPGGDRAFREWAENHDFQIYRNRQAFPRAWVVHNALFLEPISRLSRAAQQKAMQEIIYANDHLWHDSHLTAFDPHRLAWVEQDELAELAPFLSGGPPKSSETVSVGYPSPQRVELDVTLESPGLVVLADVYYPGWELTIDGRPAPIHRANRLMRGAALPAGPHHLVYTYAPRSFRVGRIVSLLGLGLLVLAGAACVVRPVDPVVSSCEPTDTEET